MKYLFILFFSHLALTPMAKESKTNKLLAEFESLPKKIDYLLMPDMQLDNHSGELSITLTETMKLVRSALMDALRGQASEIGDGVKDNVQKANYKLQQSMKSVFPFNGDSILLDDDVQELTDQLRIVLELTPDVGDTKGPILEENVIDVCRMVINDVYKKQHLVRSNVKPSTWKSFKDTGDQISAISRSYSASEDTIY